MAFAYFPSLSNYRMSIERKLNRKVKMLFQIVIMISSVSFAYLFTVQNKKIVPLT